MAENGYGPTAGHIGRIPNYGKTHVNPMGAVEPPACIQNAMMTKDKKPFTYTPGGLDLSQIKTPSMARRLARQRSNDEHEQQQYYPQQHSNGGYHPQGGPAPPPPPPPKMPVPPPPPPPIVIQAPNSKSPKPIAPGERPEIVIPENPIGMLRKTNSPYHWEVEKAEMQKLGNTPKYIEKVPSPLTVKMPPSSFTQQQPQTYTPPSQNNYQRSPYSNQRNPESPIYKPEAQYAHQHSASPQGSPPTREILQRQDSQFNKSPQPFTGLPSSNSSPYSPSPNNNWRQPEKRDSPASNVHSSPQSIHSNRTPFSPNVQQYSPNTQQYSPNTNNQQYTPNHQNQSPPSNSGPVFHTLPRAGQRNAEPQNNNVVYNNTKPSPPTESNTAPWRTATLNRHPREQENHQPIYNNTTLNQEPYIPPWKVNQNNNTAANNENTHVPAWKQENKPQQQYIPPWVNSQDSNNKRVQENNTAPWRSHEVSSSPPKSNQQEQPRYQSTMSIPVTPRKQNPPPQPEYNNAPQKEIVYVNEEPVYFCPESPKSIPPWVKTQKEKTKTPPPTWVQRPLDGRKSLSRELNTPPRDTNQEPEWVRKSNEMQRGAREVVSPPKYQQSVQPSWSTRPSENRKSLPRDNAPGSPGTRVIPIQMEVSTTETRDSRHGGHPQPGLRITIGMNPNPEARAPFSPPTQRIMRVLSPQLVRLEDSNQQPDLPTLNRSFQDSQPKTRIIPIQIEGGNGRANESVYYHKFTQEGPPRQSKAFRVLQIITGTEDLDNIQVIEKHHGFTDL